MPKRLFTAEEIKKIEDTVQIAEAESGGEIVPVFTKQAAAYEIAWWRGGLAAMLFSALLLTCIYYTTDWLLLAPPYLWLLFTFACGLMAAFVVKSVPALTRLCISKARMRVQVLDQAKNMFYDRRIADTEQRTGMLLFISFLERQAVILADIGIAELVEDARWEAIMHQLIEGLKQHRTTDSICEAILACGQLLNESGVQKAETDNELPDHIQFE